jgi:hypothetical protein
MTFELGRERRSPTSVPLRQGALRCCDCGTTWFETHAELAERAGRRCRRCGGQLHTERRQPTASQATAAA